MLALVLGVLAVSYAYPLRAWYDQHSRRSALEQESAELSASVHELETELRRAEADGHPLGSVTLEDYAYVALGLLEWAEFSGKEEDFHLARQVLERGWAAYYGADGWRQPPGGAILSGAGAAGMTGDGPTPSPAGVMAQVSLRLARKYHDRPLKARALTALRQNGARLAHDPFWHATELSALYFQD